MSENTSEESYSMYPNTQSSPPMPHGNMRFPVYQPPTPVYVGYPQGPYMYAAAQTPNYHFKMMNQNQGMMYQGANGIQGQQTNTMNNGNSMPKKKWNNNNNNNNVNSNNMVNGNNNNNNNNNAMGGGNMYQNKPHNYYQSQHYYNNNTNINGNGVSMNNKSNSSTAVYDPFKFDSSKSSSNSDIDLNVSLPIFINTNASEFAAARAKRYELKIQAIQNKNDVTVLKTTEVSVTKKEKTTQEETKSTKKNVEPIENKTKSTHTESISRDKKEKKNEQNKSIKDEKKVIISENKTETNSLEKKSKKTDEVPAPSKVKSSEETPVSTTKTSPSNTTSTTPIPPSKTIAAEETTPSVSEVITTTTTPDKEAVSSNVAPKAPVRSWSSIASSAAVKTKPNNTTTTKNSTISSTTTSKQPQKKDKNYVPPSTKGSEPLGTLALRMCFDPDYINYALNKNKNGEHPLPINSIIPRGIINSANICFMSSVLQVLLYCKPFISILNVVSTRNLNSRLGGGSCQLLDACIDIYKQFDRETFEQEKKNSTKENNHKDDSNKDKKNNGVSKQYEREEYASAIDAIKPEEFYKVLSKIPKFKDLQWGHQEDAEEFLTHLLDQLHEEFISCIDCLTENEIQNLLQSINDEPLKIFFIRNLQRYKKATFIQNASSTFKELLNKYGLIGEDDSEETGDDGWHEVSSSSKKGKKNKTAAKRTVEIIPSPISNLFGGQFRSVLDIPNNKESQSITLDPFQTIQLDISDPNVNDLESAFKKFSEFELLPFKSSNGSDVEAKKQTFVDKLPEVLLIQLKRFAFVTTSSEDKNMANYNSYNGRIEKIRKKIDYPHHLTIPKETVSSHSLKYNENNRQYELSGIIYHHGVSPDGGHYTADVYHKDTDKWYRIDDINITALKHEDVLEGNGDGLGSRTAYILIYQKI